MPLFTLCPPESLLDDHVSSRCLSDKIAMVVRINLLMSSFMLIMCYSVTRKPIFKQYQSVASENIGCFILLPFELSESIFALINEKLV
jgi:hypothetical protein